MKGLDFDLAGQQVFTRFAGGQQGLDPRRFVLAILQFRLRLPPRLQGRAGVRRKGRRHCDCHWKISQFALTRLPFGQGRQGIQTTLEPLAAKDEFRALEWLMWEMGLVGGEYTKINLGYSDQGDD